MAHLPEILAALLAQIPSGVAARPSHLTEEFLALAASFVTSVIPLSGGVAQSRAAFSNFASDFGAVVAVRILVERRGG